MARLLCTTLYPNLIWWEDFEVGEEAGLGRHTFTEQEIVAFGRQYDPQPFHVDACAVGMRLMCERTINKTASLGSPGEHRWEALNQHGELVLTMEGWGLFGRKN